MAERYYVHPGELLDAEQLSAPERGEFVLVEVVSASDQHLTEDQLAEALDAIIAASGPITRQWSRTAARRIIRHLEGEAGDG